MIDVGAKTVCFACDECGIHEQVERRMQVARTFDEVVKAFLKANESKAEDVKKFVSKYAKGGNYFAITESTLAAKLLDDFKETFKIKE